MSRATPLPPDERRARLVDATAPLLETYGREVSTRQIAEAAGVAEGTIFRVFPTKDALVDAVIEDAFGVSHTCADLAALPPTDDLEQRLVDVVGVLQRRLRRVFALFHALRLGQRDADHEAHRARQQADNARLDATLVDLLAPDLETLRLPPERVAYVLRTMTFAFSHPLLSGGQPADPASIVDVVLHGVSVPSKEHLPC